jgi:hypothetical protein
MSHLAHLVRRFVGSWSKHRPGDADVAWAWSHLLPREATLWNQMSIADQRHAIEVARRFVAASPDASAAEVAGALLHDIGKLEARLGTICRVVATIVGPRTVRFRSYHDHEAIGAQMLVDAGSDPVTVELVQGRGRCAIALRAADDV